MIKTKGKEGNFSNRSRNPNLNSCSEEDDSDIENESISSGDLDEEIDAQKLQIKMKTISDLLVNLDGDKELDTDRSPTEGLIPTVLGDNTALTNFSIQMQQVKEMVASPANKSKLSRQTTYGFMLDLKLPDGTPISKALANKPMD